MKSTKYQLLKGDYDHACEQLKIHKKIIEELREENERFKRMYENTGAIFNRQLMKDKIERYEEALKFYADKENYEVVTEGLDPMFSYVHIIDTDEGDKARKALGS